MSNHTSQGVFREMDSIPIEMSRYDWADQHALLTVPGVAQIPKLLADLSLPMTRYILRGGRMETEDKGICLTSVKQGDESIRITLTKVTRSGGAYMMNVMCVSQGKGNRLDVLFGDEDREEPLMEAELVENIHVMMRDIFFAVIKVRSLLRRWFGRWKHGLPPQRNGYGDQDIKI